MEFLKEYIDFMIFSILGFMSFIVVWFSIERFISYKRLKFSDFKDLDSFEEAVTKNLTILYIIYSNAPYIGLLGTVVGIMITFHDMGASGNMNASEIMIGLSLALKATALGLVVAIPTLIIYNGFLRKVDVLVNRYKASIK
ncbi:TonB-system energizer ExbB [Helicobacter sp. MIT 99-5507]|uniref:TonB-system energizer ExbB n=1 Tax=Helicobacter sp. MIT 99-5507 TaxID=152489 RepID=UPI000E1EF5D3|nr:TonB-system energizer ExbB [Helicobacter sp. MIT 99-5507]RDU57816.1 TonB-system energizer ExbB [Helicobacter sp. MIT 99-5507]